MARGAGRVLVVLTVVVVIVLIPSLLHGLGRLGQTVDAGATDAGSNSHQQQPQLRNNSSSLSSLAAARHPPPSPNSSAEVPALLHRQRTAVLRPRHLSSQARRLLQYYYYDDCQDALSAWYASDQVTADTAVAYEEAGDTAGVQVICQETQAQALQQLAVLEGDYCSQPTPEDSTALSTVNTLVVAFDNFCSAAGFPITGGGGGVVVVGGSSGGGDGATVYGGGGGSDGGDGVLSATGAFIAWTRTSSSVVAGYVTVFWATLATVLPVLYLLLAAVLLQYKQRALNALMANAEARAAAAAKSSVAPYMRSFVMGAQRCGPLADNYRSMWWMVLTAGCLLGIMPALMVATVWQPASFLFLVVDPLSVLAAVYLHCAATHIGARVWHPALASALRWQLRLLVASLATFNLAELLGIVVALSCNSTPSDNAETIAVAAALRSLCYGSAASGEVHGFYSGMIVALAAELAQLAVLAGGVIPQLLVSISLAARHTSWLSSTTAPAEQPAQAAAGPQWLPQPAAVELAVVA